MLHWTIELKRLELKYTWAIARNASDFKTNAFVTVTDGTHIGVGEAAPNIRYMESPELLLEEFDRFKHVKEEISSIEQWSAFLLKNRFPNALRFAIESAYVHYVSQSAGLSVSSTLGLSAPLARDTAYTIPIMVEEKLENYFLTYRPDRFKHVKIKVNQENLVSFVQQVRANCSNTLIIDANEAYEDPKVLLRDLQHCGETNIAFIEQPFPAGSDTAYRFLKSKCPFPVFADESVTDSADFEHLSECFHGINVKLMKAGGYLNGIRLLKEAKAHGMSTMIGCMVETGLGISSGLHISSLADFLDLDSFLILQSDPFVLVQEENGKVFLYGHSLHA